MSDTQQTASYGYWNLANGNRLHHWPGINKWAIGHGPIRDVTEDEARAILAESRAAYAKRNSEQGKG